MPFIETADILNALQARIDALQWNGGDLIPVSDTDTGARSRVYSSPKLAQAMGELLVFEERAAFIVPVDDDFENEVRGYELLTRVRRRFAILLADQDYGDRMAAFEGDADNPGVIEMAKLVVNDISGSNLGLRGCRVMLETGEPIQIARTESGQTDETLPGREAYAITLQVDAGENVTENRKL